MIRKLLFDRTRSPSFIGYYLEGKNKTNAFCVSNSIVTKSTGITNL